MTRAAIGLTDHLEGPSDRPSGEIFEEVDESAFAIAEPPLRTLWRRSRHEGKIPVDTPEPGHPADLRGHPINFVVGGPESVARQLMALRERVPFDVANVEVRRAGLSHEQVLDSLRRLMEDVAPRFYPP